MALRAGRYATQLRRELTLRNRKYARGRPHVESYGSEPVIVYTPEEGRHGNFFDPSYTALAANSGWMRRFDKIHAQAARSLPKPQLDPNRRWRELDSSMSSDALLMNIFCTPGVAESPAVRSALGVDGDADPIFGWKARVPLANGRFDRTEVDMHFGSLLVEAKLTEVGFQARASAFVEAYRDFDLVFDRDLLPQAGRLQLRDGCGPVNSPRMIRRNSRASSAIPRAFPELTAPFVLLAIRVTRVINLSEAC